MRSVGTHLRCAWLEYQEIQDAIVFMHAATARLGFVNALAALPKGAGGPRTRQATNLPDMKIRVRAHRSGKTTFRALVGEPSAGDAKVLADWVSSPAVDGAEFSSDPASANALDMLALSGHGMSGKVWGDGSGDDAGLEISAGFSDNVGRPRSGRLKCLMIPSCNNLHEMMAGGWISAFDHPQPVYVILGYHETYAGGTTGARVMAKFVKQLAKTPSMALVAAWRAANEPYKQPWAALVAKGAEGMNLEDWVGDKLPKLSAITDLVYFDAANSSGRPAILGNEDHQARWVMADGTVLDSTNNRVAHVDKGLFSGAKGTIRIKALKADQHFKVGDGAFLGIYLYRDSKVMDISDLLEFDASLLTAQPATGKPLVEPERDLLRGGGGVQAFKINVAAAGDTIELPFTVKPDAAKHFKPDGPGGSRGQFVLDFGGPDVSTDEIDQGGDRNAFWFQRPEVTAGALLWK